jgi:hypothetical protein
MATCCQLQACPELVCPEPVEWVEWVAELSPAPFIYACTRELALDNLYLRSGFLIDVSFRWGILLDSFPF